MNTTLRATFWNVMELGGTDKKSRTRRQYVFNQAFRDPWDVIGLIAVRRSARSALEKAAKQHHYEVIATPRAYWNASGPREAHTVMLVRRDLNVLKMGAEQITESRRIERPNASPHTTRQLLLGAAGVAVETDDTALAVVCIYTPYDKQIGLRGSPASSLGIQRDAPGHASASVLGAYKDDICVEEAVKWANAFQHSAAADGLIIGGDWNALSDPAFQDRRDDIAQSGTDASGRAWTQLLQERVDPIPTYSYGHRLNRARRFIDQAYVRLPDGFEGKLGVAPPQKIARSKVRLGFASDHAQLRVEARRVVDSPSARETAATPLSAT